MPAVLRKENNTMDASSDDEEDPVRPARKKSRVTRQTRRTSSATGGDSSGHVAPSPSSQTTSLVEGYRELANEMCNLDIRPENTVQNARRATDLIDRADVLADMAYNASGSAAANYDGEFMNVAGQVVHRIAETMEVDSRVFCVREFAVCLKQFLSGSRNTAVTKSALTGFSRDVCRIRQTASAPVLKFMHGSHNFTTTETPEAAARPAPKKRTRLVVSPTKTRASVIHTEESLRKVDKDQTVIEVEKLHTQIDALYKSRGKKPLPYLSIVVDPDDFGKTVENVFHFSFLVKEGYDKVTTHSGITSVIPVPESERMNSKKTPQNRQLLFSFSQKDWVQWCHKIKDPKYRIN